MVAEILGQATSPGGYVSIWKIILFILLFGFWAWVGQWINRDTVAVRTRRQFWNYIYMGSGIFAFLMWFLLPAPFIVVCPLFIVVWATVSTTYVLHRNARVSRDKKILTRDHIRLILSREGKKEIEARLTFISSNGNLLPAPIREDSEYDGFVTAESLVYDIATRRVSRAEGVLSGENYQMQYVIDGVLGIAGERDRIEMESGISYLKAVGGLEVEDRRRPQSGQFSILRGQDRVEWRIRTAGSTRGEQLVLERIEEQKTFGLDALGFNSTQLEKIQPLVKQQPRGIIIVCGTKGCGQSTTLYSLVRCHDAFIQNVHSLELNTLTDLDNITQHIVESGGGAKNGARMLQSILRSDPDVVMVDFCNDPEMAKIGTNAVSDGKKLYFGIETQSTFHALQRWLKMVEDNRRVSKTLLAILSQRLIRKLCLDCRQAYRPDAALLKKMNLPVDKIKQFFRPGAVEHTKKGVPILCPNCQGTGYFGRTAVFETLFITDGLRKLIREDAPINAIRAQYRKDKMLYLQEEAIRKVIDGTTSIQEVLRVTAEKAVQPAVKRNANANSPQKKTPS